MTEVYVAIVRIRAEALAQLVENKSAKITDLDSPKFFGPADFDLLMDMPPPPLFASGPSCSSQVQIEHQALALPRCRTSAGETAADAARRFMAAAELLDNNNSAPFTAIRALNIALAEQQPKGGGPASSPSLPLFLPPSSDHPQLVLIPITLGGPNSSPAGHDGCFQFCPFATVLHAAMNYDSSLVDSNSHNLLVRLGEWLSQGQCRSGPAFLHSLFLLPAANKRILHCVHNPAYDPRMFGRCHRTFVGGIDKENNKLMMTRRQGSSELEEVVKLSNAIRAEMLQREKYDKYVINPLFGTDIPSRRRAIAPDYFVRGRQWSDYQAKRRRRSTGASASGAQHQRSPTEFWEQQYPLHNHAFDGNGQKIKELLAQGFDPNELDNDFWTPLHYCAFYNRLDACQAVLLDPRTDVNVPNRTGATPLHFAALNGHVYVAELLLSHQLADINIRDSTGKTPLDLCAGVPKADWQGVAFLLQQSERLRPTKMEVQLAGGGCLQVEVADAETATAGELRTKVLEMEGLEPALGGQIFAIWLVNSRLSLQLKAEQKVQVHLDKWAEHLEKFGGEKLSDGQMSGGETGRVRVVLKRDARTLLGDEQMLARKSPVAISLLYGEAEAQFLAGMFPCHEKHSLPMAAIVAHRIYGHEWPPSGVDVQFLSRILPAHLVPVPSDFRAFASLVSKLRQAHRPLVGLNLVQLQHRFLQLCWSLNVYGCTFFRAFMLMAKPLRGNLQVQVGLNDWGLCVLNASTHRQVAAIEMDKLEVKFTANTHFLEVQSRKRDFVATVTTPQAQLINNLLKQLKLKVQAAKTGTAPPGPTSSAQC